MSDMVETKEEKKITIENEAGGGTTFIASYNILEKHIVIEIKNGIEPASVIPIRFETLDKLATWLTARANEIASL